MDPLFPLPSPGGRGYRVKVMGEGRWATDPLFPLPSPGGREYRVKVMGEGRWATDPLFLSPPLVGGNTG